MKKKSSNYYCQNYALYSTIRKTDTLFVIGVRSPNETILLSEWCSNGLLIIEQNKNKMACIESYMRHYKRKPPIASVLAKVSDKTTNVHIYSGYIPQDTPDKDAFISLDTITSLYRPDILLFYDQNYTKKALLGAEKTLHRIKPIIIISQTKKQKQNTSLEQVLEYMQWYKYDGVDFEDHQTTHIILKPL